MSSSDIKALELRMCRLLRDVNVSRTKTTHDAVMDLKHEIIEAWFLGFESGQRQTTPITKDEGRGSVSLTR